MADSKAGPKDGLVPSQDGLRFWRVSQVRILYADTDKMGVVYHGTYLRYMEHGRVELIRQAGMAYSALEREGFWLPVTELAVHYALPARYDDLLSIHVAIAQLSPARLHFAYRLTVEPGDRADGSAGGSEPEIVLLAQTRHCCLRASDRRPCRIPESVYGLLQSWYMDSAAS